MAYEPIDLLAQAVMELHLDAGEHSYTASESVRDWQVAGDPEWGKMTYRLLRDWIAEHGRPTGVHNWPWSDRFFDQFDLGAIGHSEQTGGRSDRKVLYDAMYAVLVDADANAVAYAGDSLAATVQRLLEVIDACLGGSDTTAP